MVRKVMWLVIVTMVVWSGNLFAAPGDLDTSFSTDGMVVTGFGSDNDGGYSVAIQADGRIVVAGYTDTGSNGDFAVARYTAAGALDTGFGTGGKVLTDFGSGPGEGFSVAIQADGKIVVAGMAYNGSNYDFAVARYTTDGALDTTFGGGDGMVTTDFGSSSDYGHSVAIQADGKIVVAGYTDTGSNNDFAVARYTTAGALDATFGTGGMVTTDFSGDSDKGYSVAIQTDGRIVVAGHAHNGSNYDFAVARYDANGALDTTFGGGDGKVVTDSGGSHDYGSSVAIQGDGRIVVAGVVDNGSNGDFAVARYTTAGALDTGFGTGGKVLTDFGNGDDKGLSVAIQADGKIVVAGMAYNGSNYDFAVARYTTDGTLNRDFDADGMVLTDFGSGNDIGYSVAIQADGKIVVAGVAHTGSDYDFAVARYEGDPLAEVASVPAGQEAWSYLPVENPLLQLDPANCKPFAVGDLTTGNLNLQVGLPPFSAGVDVYLAIGFSDALFLIDGSNVLHSSTEVTVLPPWKTNNSAAIDESLYGNIPTSLLPAGVYNLYTLVVPAGETDFSHYYFWATNFVIDH